MQTHRLLYLFVLSGLSMLQFGQLQAQRAEALRDTPMAIQALSTCDLEELGVRDTLPDSVQILALPSGLDGCLIAFPGSVGSDVEAQEALIPGIRGFGHPSLQFEVTTQTIPGCYGAQASADVMNVDVTTEQADVLVRGESPSTPEALIEGTVLDWSTRDSEGPVYYRLMRGAYTLIPAGASNGADGELVVPEGGTEDGIDEATIVEVIDECTTRITRVRGDGEGTTVAGAPGGTPGTEVPEEPFIFPPVEPPLFPPEEDDEEERDYFCTVRDGYIYTPVTREFLELEDRDYPPVSPHDAALGAYSTQLKSGRMLERVTDLMVKARGFNFAVERTYAGHMTTNMGGNLGHRWQLSFDQRITVLSADEEIEGLKAERLTGNSRISYTDGFGNLGEYDAVDKGVHQVLNFSQPQPFWAHITTYQSPAGAFHEIQRYVVVSRSDGGLRPAPDTHPFRTHADVDTENGEVIFYVLRTPRHEQFVFNCRGQVIYRIDRFNNRMQFNYEGAINPLTHNKTLTKVTDAAQREFVVTSEDAPECTAFATHYNGRLVANACAPIQRFASVADPWGRDVQFRYSADGQLNQIDKWFHPHHLVSGYTYTANGGAEHLLASAYQPEQGPGAPYLHNSYANSKISRQSLGGNEFRLSYPADAQTVVVDPNGNELTFDLADTPAGTVVERERLVGRGDVDATTQYAHNVDGQVTRIVYPLGNALEFAYHGSGGPVRIADAPMQNLLDLGITYRNSLSKGRLESTAQVSPFPDDITRTIKSSFTYEPLYNSIASRTDPKGTRVGYEYVYDTAGAYGNPTRVELPERTLVNGERLNGLFVRYRYNRFGDRLAEVDLRGVETRRFYDAHGAVTRIEMPLDEITVLHRDERSNLIREVRPDGLEVSYTVDIRDLVTNINVASTPRSSGSSYTYDKNYNMIRSQRNVVDLFDAIDVVQPDSKTVNHRIDYDILNRPTHETTLWGGQELQRILEYDGNGNVEVQTTPSLENEPLVTTFSYDAADRVIAIAAAEKRTELLYDANGNRVQAKDALAERMDFRYDGFDRLVGVTDKLGTVYRMQLDEIGNVLLREVTGYTGALSGSRELLSRVRVDYDEYSQPMRMAEDSLAGGYGEVITEWLFDRLGDVAEESLSTGSRTRIQRDRLGREVQITDAIGNITQLVYAPGNRLVQMTEAQIESRLNSQQGGVRQFTKVYTTEFEHDDLGNVIRQRQGVHDARFYFDSDGNMRGRDDGTSLPTAMIYDGFGRLIGTVNDLNTTRVTYMPSGLIKAIETSEGTESRSYDVAGQLLTTQDVFGNETRFTYDEVGNVATVTDPNDQQITNSYGPSGLLELSETATEIERFRHDGLGRVVFAANGVGQPVVVERSYDGLGQLLTDTQSYLGAAYTLSHDIKADQRSRALSFPAIAGAMQVTYNLDALGRVDYIDTGESNQVTASYHYAGDGRLAGRFLGTFVSDYEYDDDRRLIGLRLHTTGPGAPVKWEATREYTGLQATAATKTYYPVSTNYGATQIERHTFTHDRYRRMSSVASEFASRRTTGPDARWHRQRTLKHNRFDQNGRLAEVLQSHAQTGTEGIIMLDEVTRASEIQRDAYAFRNTSNRVAEANTTIRKTNQVVAVGAAGLAPDAITNLFSQPGDFEGYQRLGRTIAYDANGNITEDQQFLYQYDFRNRLIEVDDKLATMGRKQTKRFVYDAFGRQVAEDYFFQNVSARAFDRKQVRYLYWQQQTVVELARAPWQAPGWQLQARYIPGAMPGSTLRMDRRINDDLSAEMANFYIHEGMDGEVAFVTPSFVGERKNILQQPYFTGEDGWFEGSRNARFVEGSRTRLPIVSRGQRYDEFTRNQHRDGGSQRAYDFAATPLLDYQRYSEENLPDLIERIQRYQPDPGFVRTLEYGMAGVVMIGTFGNMVAVSELQGLLFMTLDGAASTAVDWGVNQVLGTMPTSSGLATSFALGALSGGVGRIATSASAIAGLPKPAEFTASLAVDTAVGTTLEVAMTGADLRQALVTNAASSLVGGAVAAGAPKLASAVGNAFSPPLQRLALSAMDAIDPLLGTFMPSIVQGGNFDRAVNQIRILNILGMPAARVFMEHVESGRLLVMPEFPIRGTFIDRLDRYLRHSEAAGQTVLAFDPGTSILRRNDHGNFVSEIIPALHKSVDSGGRAISIQPVHSSRVMAASILHEFSHSLGANELQAFHITFDSLVRLKAHRTYTNDGTIQDAVKHMSLLGRHKNKQWARRVMDMLGAKIKYWYDDIWDTNYAHANLKTDPAGWVYELGAPPWE